VSNFLAFPTTKNGIDANCPTSEIVTWAASELWYSNPNRILPAIQAAPKHVSNRPNAVLRRSGATRGAITGFSRVS